MKKEDRGQQVVNWILDNVWQVAIVISASYAIIQYQRGQLPNDQLVVWLLAIVELLAISGIVERHRRLENIQRAIENLKDQGKTFGLYKIYEDRTQFPPILQDLLQVRHELFIVGLALRTLTLTYADAIKDLAMRGYKVRVLMIAPEINGKVNPVIKEIAANLNFDADTYSHDVRSSLNSLVKMRSAIPLEKQQNVEIRVFTCVPTFVLMAFDGNTSYGKVRVDIIPYHISRSLWPGFEFRFDERSKLYQFYYDSAKKLWESDKDTFEYIVNSDSSVKQTNIQSNEIATTSK